MPPSGARRWRCSPPLRAGRPHRFQVDLHGRRGGHPAVRAHVFSMLQTRDPYRHGAVAVAVGLVYAALYGPQGGLFSAQFPPEVRYSGISLAVRCRAPSAADWRRWSPRRCWPTAAATLRLVPERAGPGRHRQRVLHAPAHALRAAAGAPWRPAHETVAPRLLLLAEFRLGYTWAPTAWRRWRGARAWPYRYKPVDLPTSTRAPAACCWASARGNGRTTASPSCAAGAASWASPSTRTRPYVPERRPGLAPRDRGGPAGAAGGGAGHPAPSGVRTAISRPTPRCARSWPRKAWTPTRCCARRRSRYRQYTDEAVAAGAFGSPSYVYAGELFWGQDRLEMLEEAIAAA